MRRCSAPQLRRQQAPPAQSWERETDPDPSRFNSEVYTYTFDDGALAPISISEAFHRIGTRVWDTAPLMSKAFEHGRSTAFSFEGKRVLEIGAGCGLLGMVVKRLYPTCNITVTEIGPLRDNLEQQLAANGLSDIPCKELDWFKTDLGAEFGVYDVVLASDIAVDPNDIPHICKLLRHFVRGETVALVGCVTVREAYEGFLEAARQEFDVAEIGEDEYHPAFTTRRIKVFRIRARTS